MASADYLCPICAKPVRKGDKDFPFCRERCRLIDLGQWLSDGYRVPAGKGPGAMPGEGEPGLGDRGSGDGEDAGAAGRPASEDET